MEKNEVKYEKIFNREKEYTEEIIPLMEKLNEACDKYAIPHMIWVVFSQDENRRGQGVCLHTSPDIACGKMTLVGNLAAGHIKMEDFAKASMAAALVAKIMGGDNDKKDEDK